MESEPKDGDKYNRTETMTGRVTVVAVEEILGFPIRVLDKGFIRIVDYMGDDSAIVQAARVSYGKGTKTHSEDASLINYLIRNSHTSPFEMCEIKLHVKLPIFVARQWVRHRTASINEYSARYSILEREFYIPEVDTIAEQSPVNKQGRGDPVSDKIASDVRAIMISNANQAFNSYDSLLANGLTEGPGLSRELARIGLPLSTYTEWYWKIDLHNLLHFLRLRSDKHAQLEIQAYAHAISQIVERWVPLTYAAFLEYYSGGSHLSKTAVNVVSRMLRGERVVQSESGLSQREWRDVMETFKIGGD